MEVPYACGPNWDRPQRPLGPVIIQGDYGPIAIRNVRVREWKPGSASQKLNVPPEGFTALFNGVDFTGFNLNPKVKKMWSIEGGVLKSPGRLEEWGADLATVKDYRDFVLMLEFRMPTISDNGINFRGLIPEIPGFGTQEQFNLRSKGGMGHLESYYFLSKATAKARGLKESEKPHVRHIDPKVGVWHKVKLTVVGKTISAELDGEVILDRFRYHDWLINMDPAPIRLQKHKVVHGQNLGKENPCPIEYRNIFIKEIGPGSPEGKALAQPAKGGEAKPPKTKLEELLIRIDKNDLPKAYDVRRHQAYVDRRLAGLSNQERARIGQLWKAKRRLHPDMPNRGKSFVRIMEYVAGSEK